MKISFTESVQVAIKAANDFLAGKFTEDWVPDWADNLVFFHRLEAGEIKFESNMEIRARLFDFYVNRVPVIHIKVEAVAFNADQFDKFRLASLRYKDNNSVWISVALPTE